MSVVGKFFYFKQLPKLLFALCCAAAIVVFPAEFTAGVKDGILLLGNSLIPALFPFMVVSTYLADSPATQMLFKALDRPAAKLFNIRGAGLVAPITGMLGGYPIGAQATARLFESNQISKAEAHRLLSWSVNPSPTFVITVLGRFLMGNTGAGAIMYISNILASFTIGIFARFLGKNDELTTPTQKLADQKNIFISSVAVASKAMLSICGWVLLFSAFSSGINSLVRFKSVSSFLKTVCEVTIGSSTAIQEGFSLPVVCAITGFGGLAVIFQLAPYLEKCDYKLKYFICWRLINAALSGFYCSKLIILFPCAVTTFENAFNGYLPHIAHTPVASIILIITCILLIFEVDNKRKLC